MRPAIRPISGAGSRGQRLAASHVSTAVARPSPSANGCALSSQDPLARSCAGMPSNDRICESTIRTATPFMNPARTGWGTNLASLPKPRAPKPACIAPIKITVADRSERMTAMSRALASETAGSRASCTASAATMRAVAELGPATGIALRPISAKTPPPSVAETKAAVTPSEDIAPPSGVKLSRPRVRTTASVATEPTAPATISRGQDARAGTDSRDGDFARPGRSTRARGGSSGRLIPTA